MAADSQVSSSWQRLRTTSAKIWASDGYLVGASGDLRAAQVIRHFTSWPKYRENEDTDAEAFAVRQLVPSIFTAADGKGITTTKDGIQSLPVTLIIAWKDNLVEVSGNGCVVVPPEGRLAIGSGCAEALGALGDAGPWVLEDIVTAARRAVITNLGCGGPICVADTKHLVIEEVK